MIYHKDTDESMTYGFVRFQNPTDAIRAMSELNGQEICGKRIKVGFARRGIDTANCKLYVKRVPPTYTVEDVHKLFSPVSVNGVCFLSFLLSNLVSFLSLCFFVCLLLSVCSSERS